MSQRIDHELSADEAPADWSDLREGARADAERHALHEVMGDKALALPPREPVVVPLGRVLAVACLVPILAMIVLGASRFDAIRAIDVNAVVFNEPAADSETSEQPTLPNHSNARATELFSEAELAAGVESSPIPGMIVKETRMMEVTAYCPCVKCCGKQARGITASGKPVSYNNGRFVAADTRLLEFGSLLRIPGYHEDTAVEVIDRGGAIKGNKIDVFFKSHEAARAWGRQILPVEIMVPAEDLDPSAEAGAPLEAE